MANLRRTALSLLVLTAVLWAMLLLPVSLRKELAIRPQETGRWTGIFLAPFLHADLSHLASNTVPLLVLGALLLLRSGWEFTWEPAA